jgi:signal transduction histidine kinase
MDILEKNKGWLELSRVYAIYSVNMMLKGRLDEAKVYIEKADKLCRLTNNKYRYNFNLIKWSEYYNYRGDFSKAIDSSTKALRYFKKVKNREMQHYVMSVIAYYHEKSNQYDSAYLYAKNLDVLKRSMGLEKMAKQSRQYKVELEVFDKENQIKEQAQKIEFQALENQVSEANRKRWVIGGIGGIAIVILISFIFIQRQKQVAKVEKAQLIIEEREQAFRSVIDGQEAERKRIAQELHDGIGQQLSGVKMALQNMAGTIKEQEESFHQQLNTVIGLVGASSSEVRHLAHQMLPQVLEEKGLSDALKDLIQSTFQASKLKFNYDDRLKNISLTKSAKLTIYRSIQELISNTIKHAEASEIDLYLYESNSNLLVAYSDNGKGMNKETAKNGLGLSGIRHRMENSKGTFTIDSPNNNGFSAILKLPLL